MNETPTAAGNRLGASRVSLVMACGGSTLDALVCKTGLLKDLEQHPLAGKMTAPLDLGSRLPV